MHVRDVEYIENGSEHLTGTLYMTTFRVVFAPDRETNDTNLVDENSHHRRRTFRSISFLDSVG